MRLFNRLPVCLSACLLVLITSTASAQTAGSTANTIDAIPIPLSFDFSNYIQSQSPIIQGAFCVDGGDNLWIFTLDRSPLIPDPVNGNQGLSNPMTWTTYYYDRYDWNAGGLDPNTITQLNDMQAEAALVFGDLTGSCGTVPVVGLWMSVVANGQRMHYLIPFVQAPPELDVIMHETEWPGLPLGPDSNPCTSSDPFYCYNTYRGRLSSALTNFAACLKTQAAPVGLSHIACFVVCAPLLPNVPLYKTCVSACHAGVFIAGDIILLHICTQQLYDERASALQSYLSCLDYKNSHCPSEYEPDLVYH